MPPPWAPILRGLISPYTGPPAVAALHDHHVTHRHFARSGVCRLLVLRLRRRLRWTTPVSTGDAPGTAAWVHRPVQQEMPLAVVRGQPILEIPQDLYIPPDALAVILDAFEGPLDLLLYLIRRQNLDILDIPVAEITRQYVQYIELMREFRLTLAAEYLVMAAVLAEIKSRLLLPSPPQAESAEESDPRAELVRRLIEYERFKKAAEELDALPRLERDTAIAMAAVEDRRTIRIPPAVDLREILLALAGVLRRAELAGHHRVQREPLSVRQRMGEVLRALADGRFRRFEELFPATEGRRGVVATFLAILELAREQLVELVQERPLAPIYLRSLAL